LRNRTTKFAALAVFGLLAAGFAFASSTATSNMSVTASIANNCTISASPLAFGAYDPIGANASTALTTTTSIAVNCTNGDSTTVTLGQGNHAAGDSTDASPDRRMLATVNLTSYYLSYTLIQPDDSTPWGNTSGTGVGYSGTGTAGSLTVNGSVPANQNGLPAGSYSDTVVATITF